MRIALSDLVRGASLCLAPGLAVGLGLWLRRESGPFWLAENFDPEYVYLFNALAIADGGRASYCDHPGTPLHLVGSLVLHVCGWLRGTPDLAADVLQVPEPYLAALHLAWVALVAASLAIAGFSLWRHTGRLAPALLLQWGPFCSPAVVLSLPRATPEPVLLALAVLLASRIGAISLCDAPPAPRREFTWGLLAGLGLATKLTFVPVVLGWLAACRSTPARLAGLAGAALSFLAWTCNPWVRIAWFFQFVVRIAKHNGQYGNGARGAVTWDTLNNLLRWGAEIARTELPVLLIITASLAGLVLRLPAEPSRRRGLVALLLAQGVQWLMNAKSPLIFTRYLVPAWSCGGLNLALLLPAETSPAARRGIRGALTLGLLGSAGFMVSVVSAEVHTWRRRQADVARIEEFLKAWPGPMQVVECYRTSSPRYALSFGDLAVEHRFATRLDALHPIARFYERWKFHFERYATPITFDELADGKTVLLRGTGDLPELPAGFTATLVASAGDERLWQVQER